MTSPSLRPHDLDDRDDLAPRAPRRASAARPRAPSATPSTPSAPSAKAWALSLGSDAELLGGLLFASAGAGPARTAVAAALLDEAGGLHGLAELGVPSLVALGLEDAEARAVATALALGRRAALAASAPRARLRGTADVVAWATPRLAPLDHEELWALGLDGRGGLVVARAVGLGGAHGMSVAPRDVLRVLLRAGAAAFVLVHNHPSGDPTPSAEDRAFTEAIAVAAELVGLRLCDHVVVAREGFAVVEPRPLGGRPAADAQGTDGGAGAGAGVAVAPTTAGRRRTSSSASRS